MTFIEDVQRAKSPREAMLNLAAGLDILVERIDALEINNGWDTWSEDEGLPADDRGVTPAPLRNGLVDLPKPAQHGVTVIQGEGSADVIIPPPTEIKKQARRLLELQSLHLAEYLNDDSEDWTEVYAKGGPWWLYLGNRELVMSLPLETRQRMVADVEEDAPAQAREMARDILKAPGSETGPGAAPALADEFAGGVR